MEGGRQEEHLLQPEGEGAWGQLTKHLINNFHNIGKLWSKFREEVTVRRDRDDYILHTLV